MGLVSPEGLERSDQTVRSQGWLDQREIEVDQRVEREEGKDPDRTDLLGSGLAGAKPSRLGCPTPLTGSP